MTVLEAGTHSLAGGKTFTVNDTDLWNLGNVSVIKIFIKSGNSLVHCTAEKINLS